MLNRLVILGAVGDLTGRYLLPSLARLHAAGRLPDALAIEGIGREDLDRARFHAHARARLASHAADVPATSRDAIVARLDYRRADVSDPAQLARALGGTAAPLVAYLALPARVAAAAAGALAQLGLPAGSRVVVEKPFGEDLASARALNALLARAFTEPAVFRVDHFLGKQTVQNILGLRFANRVFETLWNRDHVARVEITWDEALALEGRASYYDRAGALRDMVQNHLLQLLALVGMEAPVTIGERDLRDRKVDVLRAVRRLSDEEIGRHTARARYAAGRVAGREVPAYVAEPGVDPRRQTETFAQVTLGVDNWRWAGVPFVLRTGKALGRERREVAVHFRPVPHLAFEASRPAPNVLRLELDPERVALAVNMTGRDEAFDLHCLPLDAALPAPELPAYARVLLDVLGGDSALSIRGDEAEESWRIVEPILAAWADGRVPLREYAAGTDGDRVAGARATGTEEDTP